MMSPMGPEHVAIISILNEFFASCLPDNCNAGFKHLLC